MFLRGRQRLRSFFKKISAPLFLEKIEKTFARPFSGRRCLLLIFLLSACLGVNIYVRLIPAYFPQLRAQAVRNATQRFRSEKTNSLAAQKIEGNTAECREEVPLDRLITKEEEKLKDAFKSPSGQTYFLENDPYAWARYTQNVLTNGHPGDKKVGGDSYDSYSLAPLGGATPKYASLLFYVSAFLYRGVSFFAFIPLERFLFFIPVFYAAAFLLTFFFFVRRSFSDLSAFFAVFLTGMSGVFINRSCAGWYDHDTLNLFLGLVITGLLLEALRSSSYKLKWFSFVFLAAFFQACFMTSWMGWWSMLPILAAFFLLSSLGVIFHHCREPERLWKKILFYGATAGVFLVVTDFFGYQLAGTHMFSAALDLSRYLLPRWGTSTSPDIWPNLLFTISELNPLKFQRLAEFFYNKWFFVAAVAGLCILVWKERDDNRKKVIGMMFCWLIFFLVASMKSQRFTFFLSVPVLFFLGVFLGDVLPAIISKKANGWQRLAVTMLFVLGLVFVTFTAGKSGFTTANGIRPQMSDGWFTALTYVEKHTPREAILNSWWDNGNWFQYYGKRRTIFDPHNQNEQIGYWMGRAFLENDESRALAILRMLNNNSGRTYYELNKAIQEPYRCERILQRLLETDRQAGAKILEAQQVSTETAQSVLDHLYAKPAPAYFIVDRSLIDKIGNISFLESWDFSKAYAYAHRHEAREAIISALEKNFGLTAETAARIANATAVMGNSVGRSEFFSVRYGFSLRPTGGKKKGALTFFDNGIVYDHSSNDVLFYDANKRKYFRPRKVIFYEAGVAREVLDRYGDYSKTIVLAKGPKKEQAFIADDPLAASLFVKLYFLGGAGLRSFKPFYADDEKGIFIYEIDWDQTKT